MSDQALVSQGSVISIGAVGDSPGELVAIGEVSNINGPNLTRSVIEASDLDSTWAEKLVGIKDGGQVTLDLLCDPADTGGDALRTAYHDGLLRSFEIALSDSPATTFAFDAYVTDLGQSIPFNDKIQRSITITVSGAVVEG